MQGQLAYLFKIIMGYPLMPLRHTRKIAIFCLMALLSLTMGTTHAYILRGPHILELMTRKFGQPKNMLVKQQVLFFNTGETGTTVADETLRYVFPEVFRSDTQSENARRIHLTTGGESMTVIDGKLAGKDERVFDLYKDLMFYRSRVQLEDRLSTLGVDMSVVAYGRFEDKIAFVIGAERPDDPVPQVWVDKESFLPVRWLMKADDADARTVDLEIRYADWRQIEHVWYPMQVVYYQDGKPVREINVESLSTNLTFPMELFDMERLRQKLVSAASEVKEGSVSGEINEIEKSIDEFRKKFE
jgi:hypothetical protein